MSAVTGLGRLASETLEVAMSKRKEPAKKQFPDESSSEDEVGIYSLGPIYRAQRLKVN